MNTYRARDVWLMKHKPDIYMAMIDTAEVVAKRYGISREAQDEYALESQKRTAIAQQAGRSDEHTSELQSLMRISYAVFCLKKTTNIIHTHDLVFGTQHEHYHDQPYSTRTS